MVATAGEYGLDAQIVKAARDMNRRQRERVVEKLLDELKILKGRTIGLLGLAFKPDTDDLREAPALDIARKLIERGARVKAHDPVAMSRFLQEYPDLDVTLCATAEEVLQDCDAAGAGHRVAGVSRARLGIHQEQHARPSAARRPQSPRPRPINQGRIPLLEPGGITASAALPARDLDLQSPVTSCIL